MRTIKNFEELAVSAARRGALEIAEAGFEAIDTRSVIKKNVVLDGEILRLAGREFRLRDTHKIIVAGVGKCAGEAAFAVEEILGERVSGGVVVSIGRAPDLKRITLYRGTHPLPSDDNIKGATALTESLRGLTENDLVIFLISGGGSTLLCLPEERSCLEETAVLEALIKAGSTIREINTVRKHLSLARGGYLAQYAYPAKAISLIFSDVPGDDIQFVASGPTVKDTTTIEEAEEILAKYSVLKTCNIEKCGLVETPKDDKYFAKVENIIIVSGKTALRAMEEKAKELGFNVDVRATDMHGEARDVGQSILKELRRAEPRTILLYSGETTVTVRGRGKGGRNLELALSILAEIGASELVMPVGSDGRDNGEYAGAICDIITKKKADDLRAEIEPYLRENNEYPFFEKVGSFIMTGDTGSNVSDLIIALKL